MCNRRVPVDICVNISIPATRDHLPRGDTLAPNRQCPLVAGTTVPSNLPISVSTSYCKMKDDYKNPFETTFSHFPVIPFPRLTCFFIAGTFITMDISTQRLADIRTVDIRNTVRRIRTQRAFSIQMPDQYIFCHLALIEHAQSLGLLADDVDLEGFDDESSEGD